MSALIPAALLWLQLQLGSVRALSRLPGVWGEVAVAAVWVSTGAAAAWLALRPARVPRWRVLSTPWPSAVLVVLVAVCALAVYPGVDDRRSSGGGSDADDAVVLVVERIRDGLDPFGADTYLGNPPTTGPGALLWAAPFPGRRALAAGVTVGVAAVLAAVRWVRRSWTEASWTALLLATSVPFWEAVAQGNDHLAMSALLAVLVLSLDRWPVLASAVLAGVLATWRAAYLHLPLLFGLARRRVSLAVAGTAVAVGLHLVLLRWTSGGWDAYDPVQQLFVKSDEDLSGWGRAIVAVATFAGATIVVLEVRARATVASASTLVFAGLGGPLFGIALAGLASADGPAGWSEASYLLPTLVLAAVVGARAVVQSSSP